MMEPLKSKSLFRFQLVHLSLLLSFCIFGGIYLMQYGPLNSEFVNSTFEATLRFEKIQKHDYIKEIKTLLETDRSRDAALTINAMERDFKLLNNLYSDPSYSQLQNIIVNSKRSINSIISLPTVKSLLNVTEIKLNKFYHFVMANNWQRLSRISGRLRTKVALRRKSSSSTINEKTLFNFSNSFKRDLKLMKTVTQNSVLSIKEKEIIVSKLKSLETESSMLLRYISSVTEAKELIKELDLKIKSWIKAMRPRIMDGQHQYENRLRLILLGVFGLIILIVAGIVGTLFFRKRDKKALQKEMEENLVDFSRNYLLGDHEINLPEKFNSNTNKELGQVKEYIHKRMSYGNIFQEGNPFPCFCLDSNLRILWGNYHFYRMWGIENYEKDENLSWDFLQRFTNLGENDPVHLALNENVAGIYQIQMRSQTNLDETMPYEMYVNPVDSDGYKRILIFFYPLGSMEETLSNQTKSLVGPVSRVLDALSHGDYNEGFVGKIEKDFEIAGIEHLLGKFHSYNECVLAREADHLKVIEDLENELAEVKDYKDEISSYILTTLRQLEECHSSFKQAQKKVISNVDLRFQLEDIQKYTIKSSQQSVKESFSFAHNITDLHKRYNHLMETLDRFQEFRTRLKGFKGELDDSWLRVSQTIDQNLVVARSESSNSTVGTILKKLKMEFKFLDGLLPQYGKILQDLDIVLSKTSLVIKEKDADKRELDKFLEIMQGIRTQVEADEFEIGKASRKGIKLDDETVGVVKNMFDHLSNISSTVRYMDRMSNEEKPNIIHEN